jgi:UPF0755 protein
LTRVVAVIAGVVAAVAVVGAAWFIYETPGNVFGDDEPTIEPFTSSSGIVDFTIAPGESASDIAARLESQGIVRSKRLFEVLVGLRGVGNSLEAGDYEFEQGLPAVVVVDRIAEGRTSSRSVLFREGTRAEEMGETLEAAGIITAQEFQSALIKSDYATPFLAQVQSNSLQGFLYPARYEFRRSATPDEVVATLLQGFQDNVADDLPDDLEGFTLDQIVTVASIVEREAQVPEERPIIASVYLNRIRMGIPLQADPTTQFAITENPASVAQYGWWKEELTVDDLQFVSPYNTYVAPGLPPGPICNPSADSVRAVIEPAQTNFLYFVAVGDGSHAFAETLEEHNANVARYQGG